MPKDVRKLVFNAKETRIALLHYCKMEGVALPPSQFEGFVLREERFSVELCFASANPKKPFVVYLSSNQAIGALIGACRVKHIPLPREGRKYLQKNAEDGITLSVGLDSIHLEESDYAAAAAAESAKPRASG
ncbi:hypothetical protein [Varunaivibrio sulfuroxidans]|uniref:Uncharacterized protein n=1 Tax=Varunaivibrio sulfuroxidans TaxID=1773489 RepID=A0A4R3JDA3_9PROT|nr:hypothetical protein [Varunaivibrio sulfuroxidans]TCS63674.1 hypothetical protein EDD55_103298 [Varunaivibrio sulfuroxidans]WES30191.1 hypothetical protein P3M64_11165 [Varunaivibrio sulfuroxidans]